MALAYMDRSVLPLFVEEIKADLLITDFQFSLLTGLAFTLFLSLSGIPVGMLLDRRSRAKIIAVGMFVWSLATSFTGLSKSFAHIFLARMALGVGESGVAPGVSSMVADMFIGKKLARAMATISIGFVMGSGTAMIIGGALAGWFGHDSQTTLPLLGTFSAWQMVFLVLGIPGLLLAPVLFFFVEDPPRKRVLLDAQGEKAKSNYFELLRFIWAHRTTVSLKFGGYICLSLANSGLAAWMPAHMLRVFNVSVSKTGVALGLTQIVLSIAAVLFAALWVDRRLESGRLDAAPRMSRNALLCALVPLLAFSLMPTFVLSVVAVILAHTLMSTAYSIASTSNNMFAPNQYRAQYTVTFLLLASLIGGAGGPTVVALLNDALFADPKMIGRSAAIVGAVALALGATLLTLSLKHYRRSIDIIIASTSDGEADSK